MYLKWAAVSYLIVVVSLLSFIWLPQTVAQDSSGGYSTTQAVYYISASSVALFGIVLAPYFGAASLIGSGSVWKKALGMVNGHISFPFIGGVALSAYPRYLFPSGYPGSSSDYTYWLPIVTIYTAFVILSTAMVVMGARGDSSAARPAAIQTELSPSTKQ